MKGCWTPLIGRFGNQMAQFAYAGAYAEQNGLELHTPRWIGEKIFKIEPTLEKQDGDLIIGGYCQNQSSLLYSRKQARRWFKFRPEIGEKYWPYCSGGRGRMPLAHRRVGDYHNSPVGYVEVSEASYLKAVETFGYDPKTLEWVTEETAMKAKHFTDLGAPFLPDFFRLMTAPVLFRGNSSFSWWAATLGEGRVFSPVINGLKGGKEEDVEFVEGNHPRLSEIGDCTEMHLFKDSDRYDYDLTPDDLVIDVGGYEGNFTAEIVRKFGCRVVIFEPCAEFFLKLKSRFSNNPKVKVIQGALGGEERPIEIGVQGDSTGEFSASDTREKSWQHDVVKFLQHEKPALIKLNCEGGEYAVMERLIEKNHVKDIGAFQIQFHTCAPDYAKRYAAIREELVKTHTPTFQEPWVWEGFELR